MAKRKIKVMGTFSKVYIKNNSVEAVKRFIGKYYKIVNEEIDSVEEDWRYWEKGNDTIILSKNYNESWVEMIINYEFTLYFHDEFLRRLSRELKTEILLGYYQSTCGDGRLAKFESGELVLSIIQSEVKYGGESTMRLMDNWGVTETIKQEFSLPSKTRESFFEIDRDMIYRFYKSHGLEWDKIQRDDEVYHYLEIRYE